MQNLLRRNQATDTDELPPQYTPAVIARNRLTLIQNVRRYWIDGYLDNALHDDLMIKLDIEDQSGAVNRDNVVRRSDDTEINLSDVGSTMDVFDELEGKMLILGAPGSGKTTMLLDLARELLDRAEKDEDFAIPVVFNVSSWGIAPKPLADWLEDQLIIQYEVPRPLAQEWVRKNHLLLMLDGLDEIVLSRRTECLVAINKYRVKFDDVPIVVCSRINDYNMLSQRLQLNGSILLQPLSDAQIMQYLTDLGDDTTSLRQQMATNEQLREMCRTPLFLVMTALAYRGDISDQPVQFDTIESQIFYVLNLYESRMLDNADTPSTHSQQDIRYYLHYIADKMIQYGQTVFYLDTINPRWLTETQQAWNSRLVNIVLGVWVFLALYLLFQVPTGFAFVTMILSVGFGGLLWVANVDGGGTSTNLRMGITTRWNLANMSFYAVLGFMLGAQQSLQLAIGLAITIPLAFSVVLAPSDNVVTVGKRQSPLLTGILNLLLVIVIIWLVVGSVIALVWSPSVGFFMGGFAGLMGGLINGNGIALIRFSVLRILMRVYGYLPTDVQGLLNYVVDCIIMRKVGSGYIFIHRYLLEYFAELEIKRDKAAKAG